MLLNPIQQVRAGSIYTTQNRGYWKLDEASGTRNDSGPYGLHLTDNNACGSAAGKIANGATFVTASSQYLSHADDTRLRTGYVDWTLGTWVKFNSLTARQAVAGKYSTLLGQEYLIEWYAASSAIRFLSRGSAYITSAVTITAGTWYFILAWIDQGAATANLQINGGTVETFSISPGTNEPLTGTSEFRIGAQQSGGLQSYADATIDETGLWGCKFDAGQRSYLYNGGAGRTWPF